MGYLSYFLEGRVFFHEHIFCRFLTVVKEAQFVLVGVVIFSAAPQRLCAQLCAPGAGERRQRRSRITFAAEHYIHYCKYLW